MARKERRDNYKSQLHLTRGITNLKSEEFALTVKGVTIFTITDDPRIKPSSLGLATEISKRPSMGAKV